MLRGIVCKVRGHVVNRHRVWHDDLNFRTTCECCGAALLRTGEGWRIFDNENDAHMDRRPHPNFERVMSNRSKRKVGGTRRPR